MAQLPNQFDATQVEPQDDFSAIPPGEYNAVIEDSELKTTKAGTGRYLQITFSVLDGQFANRKLWARLNLENPNQTAVDIAQRELSAICHAVGVLKVSDSAELHGKTLRLKVALQKDNPEMNEIKGYKRIDGTSVAGTGAPAAQAAAPAAAQSAEAQPATTGSVPPWQRRAS